MRHNLQNSSRLALIGHNNINSYTYMAGLLHHDLIGNGGKGRVPGRAPGRVGEKGVPQVTTTLEKTHSTLLVRDPEAPSLMPAWPTLTIVREPKQEIAARKRNLFVLTTATNLGEVARFVSTANKRNQLRALFVRCDVNAEWLPQMFELAKLRTMRNTLVHSNFKVPWRVLRAWQMGAQEELIADAEIVGDNLFVTSCEPTTYRVPIGSVPALGRIPVSERKDFRVADDGSYLAWPTQDIHLDLDSLLVGIEPERRMRAERVKRAYGRSYGEAIARLRHETGLRQEDIPGLSDREVRRIEGEGEVTVDSLRKLALAHNMDLSEYLNEVAKLADVRKDAVADMAAGPARVGYRVTKKK